MGYLTNFIVYTLAMIGVIILALVVFKYSTGIKVRHNAKNRGLKVIDTLSLSPRKTLYVIETEGEKFLIAGDTDRTTLISKLGPSLETRTRTTNSVTTPITNDFSDKGNLGIHSTQKNPYNSIMRSLAEKIK